LLSQLLLISAISLLSYKFLRLSDFEKIGGRRADRRTDGLGTVHNAALRRTT